MEWTVAVLSAAEILPVVVRQHSASGTSKWVGGLSRSGWSLGEHFERRVRMERQQCDV